MISGAFSLTSQAMQLGYCPRIHVRFTSEREKGQIYIPNINWLLLIAVVSLLLSYIGATVGLVLGQLRVALLVYALGSATVGAATSLAISTAGTLIGTLRHAVDGRVQLKLLLSVGLPSAAAAFFSARYAQHVDQRLLKLAIALVLILTGLKMLLPRRPVVEPEVAPKVPLTGLSAGVATFLEGQIDLYAFAVVAPTTVIGAHFGAHKTGLLAPETLSRVIAWVLAATGLLMLAEDLIKRWLAP